MKHSNYFLALTTGCLAVASFASAKSHRQISTNAWCDLSDQKTGCALQVPGFYSTTPRPISQTQATCVSAQFPHSHHLVYTANCVTALYTSLED